MTEQRMEKVKALTGDVISAMHRYCTSNLWKYL